MKIDVTTQEYRMLIDLLEIADWVLHSHKANFPDETKPYRDIANKILSYAEQVGMENLIDYSGSLEGYYPTREFEETSDYMYYIQEFESDSFWDELINRLAERDLFNNEGEENVKHMGFEERARKLSVLERQYADEFEKHGLDNLFAYNHFVTSKSLH